MQTQVGVSGRRPRASRCGQQRERETPDKEGRHDFAMTDHFEDHRSEWDRRLRAYANGEGSDAERAALEAFLRRSPEDRARLRELRRESEASTSALEASAMEAVRAVRREQNALRTARTIAERAAGRPQSSSGRRAVVDAGPRRRGAAQAAMTHDAAQERARRTATTASLQQPSPRLTGEGTDFSAVVPRARTDFAADPAAAFVEETNDYVAETNERVAASDTARRQPTSAVAARQVDRDVFAARDPFDAGDPTDGATTARKDRWERDIFRDSRNEGPTPQRTPIRKRPLSESQTLGRPDDEFLRADAAAAPEAPAAQSATTTGLASNGEASLERDRQIDPNGGAGFFDEPPLAAEAATRTSGRAAWSSTRASKRGAALAEAPGSATDDLGPALDPASDPGDARRSSQTASSQTASAQTAPTQTALARIDQFDDLVLDDDLIVETERNDARQRRADRTKPIRLGLGAAVLGFCAMALGFLLGHGPLAPAETGPLDWRMSVAASSALLTPESFPVEPAAQDGVTALSDIVAVDLGPAIAPPDGLALKAATHLRFGRRDLARIAYVDQNGAIVTLSVIERETPPALGERLAFEAEPLIGRSSVQWRTDTHAFLLFGGSSDDQLLRFAHLFAKGFNQ